MEAVLNSALLVFIGEMGDKTQLLALILVARYKQPWVILFGVLIATLANHALAAGVGEFVSTRVSHDTLRWVLGSIFILFAFWVLVPDKEGEIKSASKSSVLITTIISFFLAEMGDKTQLATLALGAKYSSTVLVTIGSTFGMLLSNALAVFLGEDLLKRVPMKVIRICASLLFLTFGVMVLIGF